MNQKHLSVNRICLLFSLLLLAAAAGLSVCLYILTKSPSAVWCGLFFCLFVFLCAALFVFAVRRRLVLFSDALCSALDEMMSQTSEPLQTPDEESLFYKISYRLKRLYEVMQEQKNSIAKERADLQELISDLSHQVKTPLANLKAINATLSEQTVPPKKQREFLKAQETQLDKLDFLMQAMIKTSRLETGVIRRKSCSPSMIRSPPPWAASFCPPKKSRSACLQTAPSSSPPSMTGNGPPKPSLTFWTTP